MEVILAKDDWVEVISICAMSETELWSDPVWSGDRSRSGADWPVGCSVKVQNGRPFMGPTGRHGLAIGRTGYQCPVGRLTFNFYRDTKDRLYSFKDSRLVQWYLPPPPPPPVDDRNGEGNSLPKLRPNSRPRARAVFWSQSVTDRDLVMEYSEYSVFHINSWTGSPHEGHVVEGVRWTWVVCFLLSLLMWLYTNIYMWTVLLYLLIISIVVVFRAMLKDCYSDTVRMLLW